jgi:hypothetical protein
MNKELYIGFDVHKDSITVALAQGGRSHINVKNQAPDGTPDACICLFGLWEWSS